MQGRNETVQSFAKGIEVLRSFGTGADRRQTITDVAGRAHMTRAAARRFLYTLCEQGWARTDGKHFELTPAVLEVGHTYLTGMSELDSVQDILRDLTRELGESSSAAMLDGTDIIYVARSSASHRIMAITLAVGARLPAHATSMGQALLAQLSVNELDNYLRAAKLTGFTPTTITDRDALRARLKAVRADGYALVSEELELGLRSISVAIQGKGKTRFAINLSAQAARVSADTMVGTFLPSLQRAARQAQMVVG